MGSVGPAEILVILVAALVILGPKRLPEAARQLGRALSEFRRVSADLQAEVRDAFTAEPEVIDTHLSEPAAVEPVAAEEQEPQAAEEQEPQP